jgi:hypothetical protein
MNEPVGTPINPMPEAPKKKTNTWLIVGIVVIVLCCCCAAVVGLGWQFGDQILYQLGIY